MKSELLNFITQSYLNSNDFNGVSYLTIIKNFNSELNKVHNELKTLIEEEKIGFLNSELSINPHINRIGIPPKAKLLEVFSNQDFDHTYFYALEDHLKSVVNKNNYDKQPYRYLMALGAAQLSYKSFDLGVLEFYRNDPRYMYLSDDIKGWISITDEFYEDNITEEKDQILLRSFGFSFDKELNRAVAVFIRYLSELSEEHQQIWKAKEIKNEYHLHPDYENREIYGSWDTGISIFVAFVQELYFINQMSEKMERPKLFKIDYGKYGDNKPKKFSFLLRPTLEEYNSFNLLLDKLMSDNINKKFFQKEIPYETETVRKDGKIIVSQKGTISLLDEWVRKLYKFDNIQMWNENIVSFKKVRKLRQNPAHSINKDVFNQEYAHKQRELMIEAYKAIKSIRLIFSNHRNCKNIEIPDYLKEGKINAF